MSMRGFEPPRSYPHTVITQPPNKFTIIYGTLMFITVFTAARHVSLSSNRLLQCVPSQLISARNISILSSKLRICLPTRFICRISPPNACIYLASLICVTRSASHFTTRLIFGEMYKSWLLLNSIFSFLLTSQI